MFNRGHLWREILKRNEPLHVLVIDWRSCGIRGKDRFRAWMGRFTTSDSKQPGWPSDQQKNTETETTQNWPGIWEILEGDVANLEVSLRYRLRMERNKRPNDTRNRMTKSNTHANMHRHQHKHKRPQLFLDMRYRDQGATVLNRRVGRGTCEVGIGHLGA